MRFVQTSAGVVDFNRVSSIDSCDGNLRVIMHSPREELVVADAQEIATVCMIADEMSCDPDDLTPDDVAHIKHNFGSLGELLAFLRGG